MPSLATSARNLFAITLGDGVCPPEPTEHVVLFDEPHRQLRRYGQSDGRESALVPVLLVPPLAASATCYDLSPGQSLVAHLLEQGRTPYVVDYGEIGWADRHLGLEAFFADILPEAIERVLIDSGAQELDLIGWSLGGTLSLFTAAANKDLPIRSITGIGTPLDYGRIPGYPEVRRITKPTNGYAVTTVLRAMGGVPAPVVQAAYRATSWDRGGGRGDPVDMSILGRRSTHSGSQREVVWPTVTRDRKVARCSDIRAPCEAWLKRHCDKLVQWSGRSASVVGAAVLAVLSVLIDSGAFSLNLG